MDDFARRKAAAVSADERNDAVGATAVAAVLDFQCGASVIPFSTKDRSSKKCGLREDVAGQDFRCSAIEREIGVSKSWTGAPDLWLGAEKLFGGDEGARFGRR